MRVTTGIRAAGRSDPGLQRENNEDRFHHDVARGLFMVVDGVGGHAAGEKAAEVAVSMLRARLERETGAVEDRVREAITVANNEVRRVASLKEEWRGMGCVLTVAVLDGADAVIGHVGDTRLYKIRGGRIRKITRDHSPVGEREDAGELSEAEAMQHPRRNEVFRDVGSADRQAFDEGFIDVTRVPFESDAALLLCTDGLTDCITSSAILDIVHQHAGRPDDVAEGLIAAANAAGGKDNVTVVYAEGPSFLTGADTGPLAAAKPAPAAKSASPAGRAHPLPPLAPEAARHGVSPVWRALALTLLFAIAAGAGYLYWSGWRPAMGLPFANAPAA
ncbi:MAG TPA: protein phosphatase 2C domain-containing protein, partial [Vicinamibacterales bacterium]